MAIKKRSQAVATKNVATSEEADALARQLADKPYGERLPRLVEPAKKARPISISLPPEIIEQLEDVVRDNKRAGAGLRTVSALIREALEAAGYGSN